MDKQSGLAKMSVNWSPKNPDFKHIQILDISGRFRTWGFGTITVHKKLKVIEQIVYGRVLVSAVKLGRIFQWEKIFNSF